MIRASGMAFIALVLASGMASPAAAARPLSMSSLVLHLSDVSAVYGKGFTDHGDSPSSPSGQPSDVRAHGYERGYVTQFARDCLAGLRSTAADGQAELGVLDAASQFRAASGASWLYKKRMQQMRTMTGFTLTSLKGLGQAAFVLRWQIQIQEVCSSLPPWMPQPPTAYAAEIYFREGAFIGNITVDGVGWDYPERRYVLRLAKIIDVRMRGRSFVVS